MTQRIYEKLITKFELKIIKLIKQGKHNSEVYNLHKQVLNDLNNKLNEIKRLGH